MKTQEQYEAWIREQDVAIKQRDNTQGKLGVWKSISIWLGLLILVAALLNDGIRALTIPIVVFVFLLLLGWIWPD